MNRRRRARTGFSLIELIIVIVLLLAAALSVTIGVNRYLDNVSETQAEVALEVATEAQMSHLRRFGHFTNVRADIEDQAAGLTVRTTAPAGVTDDGGFDPNVVGIYSPVEYGFQTVILVAQAESGTCYYRAFVTDQAPAGVEVAGEVDVFDSDLDRCATAHVLAWLDADGRSPWPLPEED